MMQQPSNTPTTANLPINQTEGCNVSGRRLQLFREGETRGDKASIIGASSVVQQPAKTSTTANLLVDLTEGCNVSARRLAQKCFCDEEASGAAPVLQKDKVSKLPNAEVGSNHPYPITEPSIISFSPFRAAMAPGRNNAWSGSAISTVGMHSAPQPAIDVSSVEDLTHGQTNTARVIADAHSRPASAPGHHNQWPGSASITVGMHSSSQPSASAANSRMLFCRSAEPVMFIFISISSLSIVLV